MTRVIRFHSLGGPEVLQIDDIAVPPPGAGEVQIKVHALGLNRAEALFRAGRYLEKAELPSKLGYEAAGTLSATGEGVTDFKVGDIVSLIPPPNQGKYGVYGELANVPAFCILKHPSNLSYEEAAASWMQYLTAYGALNQIASMQKGDFVVISAASSSVGLAAIQLTLLSGAIPIALTRTSKKKQALLDAGAAHVIATQEENVTEKLLEITHKKGARIVFDPVGGKTVNALMEGMTNYGIIIIYGALSLEPTPFPLRVALKKGLTMRGYTLWELMSGPHKQEGVDYIMKGLENGKLKPVISKTFKFEDMVEAHKYLESNAQFGKIVVTL